MAIYYRIPYILCALLILCLCTPAFAAKPGPYAGGQLGVSGSHSATSYNNSVKTILKRTNRNFKKSNSHLAGRLEAGWQFNNHLGLEAGFTRFGEQYRGGRSGQAQALDVLGKASIPVNDKFDIYGKAGAAYLTTKVKPIHSQGKGHKHSAWRPAVGMGATASVTERLTMDISFMHIHGKGKHSQIRNQNYLGAGLTVHF